MNPLFCNKNVHIGYMHLHFKHENHRAFVKARGGMTLRDLCQNG